MVAIIVVWIFGALMLGWIAYAHLARASAV
jgi:hypothetical protein